MNLHGFVSGAIGTVNPPTFGTVLPSAGTYTTNPDGSRTPNYGSPITTSMQVQALTTKDLMHLDTLNIQGSTHAIYMNGDLEAIVRATNRGGDLITLADGSIFLTTEVLEHWPDWTKASVTLQRNPSQFMVDLSKTGSTTPIG